MRDLLTTFSVVSGLLYLFAATIQWLWLKGRAQTWRHAAYVAAWLAIIVHGYLLHQWIDIGGVQNLTFFNVLSQIIWLIGVLILILGLWRPVTMLGSLIFPLAALSILLVQLFPSVHSIDTRQNPLQLVHILLSFLTISVFWLAAAQALLLALQERLLRKGLFSAAVKPLPPLETMETLLFQMILVGFILLTLILITSMIFFPLQTAIDWQHMLIALLAWGIFLVLLIGRYRYGWRGQLAIRWSLVGIILLLLSYFGSRLLVELLA